LAISGRSTKPSPTTATGSSILTCPIVAPKRRPAFQASRRLDHEHGLSLGAMRFRLLAALLRLRADAREG
jgi:hypothetical protein